MASNTNTTTNNVALFNYPDVRSQGRVPPPECAIRSVVFLPHPLPLPLPLDIFTLHYPMFFQRPLRMGNSTLSINWHYLKGNTNLAKRLLVPGTVPEPYAPTSAISVTHSLRIRQSLSPLLAKLSYPEEHCILVGLSAAPCFTAMFSQIVELFNFNQIVGLNERIDDATCYLGHFFASSHRARHLFLDPIDAHLSFYLRGLPLLVAVFTATTSSNLNYKLSDYRYAPKEILDFNLSSWENED